MVHACSFSQEAEVWDVWIREAEFAASQDHATTVHPGWQRETFSQKKKKEQVENVIHLLYYLLIHVCVCSSISGASHTNMVSVPKNLYVV